MMMLRGGGRVEEQAYGPETEHKRWLWLEPEPELPPANGQDRYNFRAPVWFSGIKESENSNNAESQIQR